MFARQVMGPWEHAALAKSAALEAVCREESVPPALGFVVSVGMQMNLKNMSLGLMMEQTELPEGPFFKETELEKALY